MEAKHGRLVVSDAKRLKALEDENTKLKKLLAEEMRDKAMLKDAASRRSDARCKARGLRPYHCMDDRFTRPFRLMMNLDNVAARTYTR